MPLISLNELQNFCKDKSIALVGNSSSILQKGYGKEIDSHDIVVRMNHGVHKMNKFFNDVGKVTTIYVCEINSLQYILQRIQEANAHYVLKLIRWNNSNQLTKQESLIEINSKLYLGCSNQHREFKQIYFAENVKPSTGATVLNFFVNFIEFNYMLMQSYDFLELYRRYNCKLQMGGDDQWSNIISGVDLIRRVEGGGAYGMTFSLLTTSEGKKMGKTQSGAVWLDPEKTSPFDFYQYWRNIDDADVEKCLALLTFLPMEEVRRLGSLPGNKINEAKTVLAYEITKLVHGEEEAVKAKKAAEALFGAGDDMDLVPTTELDKMLFEKGMNIIDLLTATELVSSKGEGRRLINQGGLLLNEEKVESIDLIVSLDAFKDGSLILKKGKKTYHRVLIN